MLRIKAIVLKEFLHIVRDKRTLMLVVCMPLIQLTLYGYAINTDVKHLATAVYDEDRTSMSRRLIEAFRESAYFDITVRADSMADARRALDRGAVKTVLHIPPSFARDVLAGRRSAVQLLIDGTDSNPANTALNTGQAVILNFLQRERLSSDTPPAIDYRPRMWYNPDLKTAFFMVPGLVGLIIQLLIPMITASAIVREKEHGNLEQLLVTPIQAYELVIGKLMAYISIALVIAVTIIAVARVLFHVPIRGNVFTLFVLTLLFLTVCLGFGLFASSLAHNQQQASQMVMFFAAPSILLSGFIFPRETMPLPIFYLGYAIPMTYYLRIVRGIVLKGLGVIDLWNSIAPLCVMAGVILWVSIRRFRKQLM